MRGDGLKASSPDGECVDASRAENEEVTTGIMLLLLVESESYLISEVPNDVLVGSVLPGGSSYKVISFTGLFTEGSDSVGFTKAGFKMGDTSFTGSCCATA